MFYCYINPPPPPFFLLSIVYFIALVWIVVQASPQPVIISLGVLIADFGLTLGLLGWKVATFFLSAIA